MKYVSFSRLTTWKKCAHKYKLMYEDNLSVFKSNLYTVFGSTVHSICENIVDFDSYTDEEFDKFFEEVFTKNLIEYFSKQYFMDFFDISLETHKEDFSEFMSNIDMNMVKDMFSQGKKIVKLCLPALRKHFGEFQVVSIEEHLYEPIDEFDSYNTKFKGFVDFVIKTPDGKIHIIDYKTCSWGWDAKKRQDPLTTYQLTLYKNYLCKKHGWDTKNVETYFVLLKRTAKAEVVEIFRVTSGKKKTENSLKMLEEFLYNVNRKYRVYPKNKKNCKFCPFKDTEHCP